MGLASYLYPSQMAPSTPAITATRTPPGKAFAARHGMFHDGARQMMTVSVDVALVES